MTSDQNIKKNRLVPANRKQRKIAIALVIMIGGFFLFSGLSAAGIIPVDRLFNPCGFKQQHNLPCPTCGMTSSALAFASGNFVRSFILQPGGGLLWSVMVISLFLALITAVFGVYFSFLERFFKEISTLRLILFVVIIILAGWAVTLTRAMSS